jgi:hypothetical protein
MRYIFSEPQQLEERKRELDELVASEEKLARRLSEFIEEKGKFE